MEKENSSQSSKLKQFNDKSDAELLDVIAWVKDEELAKAILNQRFKKVVQDLIKDTQENTQSTNRFNKIMIFLTVVLVVLTTVLVWLTIKLV